jgi:hypothetical protein
MVVLGIANSRMKDFFDLGMLASVFDFEGSRVSRAIKATLERRKTPLSSDPPLALTEDFYDNAAKQVQWSAFIRKGRLRRDEKDFKKVVWLMRSFLMPPTVALVKKQAFGADWPAGGPWRHLEK